MKNHTNQCGILRTQGACTCKEQQCYTRHEPMPGVHQDIPHLKTQCMASPLDHEEMGR